MPTIKFPLDLRFKLLAIGSQILLTDAAGHLVFYVRQKAFRLREAVTIYADAAQTKPVYRIAADRVFDISARYRIEDQSGALLGVLFRRGMQSLWRAHYEVHRNDHPFLVVREENPWIKVLDGILDSIPLVGMFTGYLLHPVYQMTRVDTGAPILRITKQAAFFEGRYRIDRSGELDEEAARLAVLSLLMMLLLERQRG